MIDESIKTLLNQKHGELNFKGLLTFMEDSGIEFRARKLSWPLGIAAFYCIYLDLTRLSKYHDKLTYFVILHEIAHYKRINKFGKEHYIKMLSIGDFDVFCGFIITEEIVADRYGCKLYYHLNKYSFPRGATQELHLVKNQDSYRRTAKQLFGVIQNSEEKYIELIESFLI